ncbi:ribonuclease III [Rhizobium rosettiformans]|jgi:ribonuclease III|uniref:Ribonuclease 3 n=2 Tax=Rhizobium rosettiformans TaxID=1368430 RepID=A0A4V6T6M3_9HYPH|nr:ribonuclease III [Rhizobium rosettiformans]MBA4797261.1 ribonuclease III [Hyphomicrobiales bacterium]MBB5274139.1 ribonuclease-3 [Rhizobium rosettiformans]MDR7026945.1 ribonuclease-3 [Rhizobium rosettiformans]MDR7065066.1 ribonuclease-3 [Rhizobium rosettiformans]THV38206.1 ribonuclease III [Rhizobium rosettiformans W3]
MTDKKVVGEKDWEQLQAAIGHKFADRDRLMRALTHASAQVSRGKKGDYERLEFLGDRVLGLCVAELLFKTFRDATEGELSVRFNQLVSAEACASVADEMELHRFIRTGSDVKKITAKNMLNVRADVVESLIAAIYLEAGLEAARGFILKYWTSRAARADGARRDAKTELQEWTHAKFGKPPIYKVADRSGPDHDPRFTVIVEIPGLKSEVGIERSKRAAEQVAATKILEREGVWAKASDAN